MNVPFLSMSSHSGCNECVDSIFAELRKSRLRLHAAGGHRGCPTPSVLAGWAQACDVCGCADLVQEVLVRVAARVQHRESQEGATPVDNPHGYLRRTAKTVLIDMDREARSRRGAAAKATGREGVAGRVLTTLRETGDQWLVVLFDLMRRHAARGGTEWPLDEFAAAKAACLNSGEQLIVDRRELIADMSRVHDVIVAVAGPAWLHDTILIPLATASIDRLELDDDAPLAARRRIDRALAVAPEWEKTEDLLFNAYCAQRRAGASPQIAVTAAAQERLQLTTKEIAGAGTTLRELAADYEALLLVNERIAVR